MSKGVREGTVSQLRYPNTAPENVDSILVSVKELLMQATQPRPSRGDQ